MNSFKYITQNVVIDGKIFSVCSSLYFFSHFCLPLELCLEDGVRSSECVGSLYLSLSPARSLSLLTRLTTLESRFFVSIDLDLAPCSTRALTQQEPLSARSALGGKKARNNCECAPVGKNTKPAGRPPCLQQKKQRSNTNAAVVSLPRYRADFRS